MMATEYRRGDRHVYRNIAGEHLLIALHGDSSEPLFALTPTAAVIWHHLEEWRSADSLAEALVRDYEVTREQAATDVQEFLAQLEEVRAVNHRETDA
jgi:hypothetical protein